MVLPKSQVSSLTGLLLFHVPLSTLHLILQVSPASLSLQKGSQISYMVDGFQAQMCVLPGLFKGELSNCTSLLLLCSSCQASHGLIRLSVGVPAQKREYQERCRLGGIFED